MSYTRRGLCRRLSSPAVTRAHGTDVRNSAKASRGERGFSLVELMVALAVSLLLLAGVLQILLSNRESFRAQRGTAHLQENARLAAFVLEHSIAHAGYRVDLMATDTGLFPAAAGGTSSNALEAPIAAGAVVSGRYGGVGDDDRVRIRFQAAGGVRNCRGEDIGTAGQPAMADFEFYVSNQTLICHQDGGDRQPIANDVDRFKVVYGIDTDDTPGVDRYTEALDDASMKQVLSVRIQLLLESSADDGDSALPKAVSQRFVFADGTVEQYVDRRARLFIDRTIALKNRLP